MVTEDGIVDLTCHYGARFAGSQEIIQAGAFEEAIAAAEGRHATYAQEHVEFLTPPVARPEKLICIGVDFPDRKADYRDGHAQLGSPSMFIRCPRSFTGHG